MRNSQKNYKAFTLSEVMITLGILGVVIAMTLPVLMSKYRKQEVSARLKKFYTIMNQAIMMSELETEILNTGRLRQPILLTTGLTITMLEGKIVTNFSTDIWLNTSNTTNLLRATLKKTMMVQLPVNCLKFTSSMAQLQLSNREPVLILVLI